MATLVNSNPPIPVVAEPIPTRYAVTDLGESDGQPLIPVALNDRGQLALTTQPPEGQARSAVIRGFLRDGDRLLEHAEALGGLPLSGLSSNGLLCGQERVAGGPLRAWALHLGDLGDRFWPGQESGAVAVNARGAVAGQVAVWVDGCLRRQVFLIEGEAAEPRLLPAPNGGSAVAAALNDDGLLLLNSTGGRYEIRSQAWLWQNGQSRLINGLPGGGTWGTTLTPQGRVAGRLRTPGGSSRAFLHEDGRTLELNTNRDCQSEALGANDQRIVVGRMMDLDGDRQAFRWTPADGMRPLGELVGDAAGWVFHKAVAINAAGLIAGRGLFQGEPRGFLLTPA